MPDITHWTFNETATRQWVSKTGFVDQTEFNFHLAAGQATDALGGQVMQLCNFSRAPQLQLNGYSAQTTITFDHYAGKYSNGHLVEDNSRAYFYINDPNNASNNGYFMIAESGLAVSKDLFANSYSFFAS